jgi:hypothetical protein
MPRFSVKDLLFGSTLIAVGVGMIVCAYRFTPQSVDSIRQISSWPFLCWVCGGGAIGAGIMTPLKRPWEGAGLGIALMTALIFLAPATRVGG